MSLAKNLQCELNKKIIISLRLRNFYSQLFVLVFATSLVENKISKTKKLLIL